MSTSMLADCTIGDTRQPDVDGEPDALKGASPVRRGAEGCSHQDVTRSTLRIPYYVPPTIEEAPWRAPEAAEIILTNSGAVVRFGGDRAFYSPTTDHIQMPPRSAFATPRGFCGTLLHECCHWTGDATRLNRDLRNRFGSSDYSREELRAELGSVMVCAELGISDCDFSNNAAYIASWLEKLRSDRKEIFRAAADAQRIADYLLAFHPDYASSHSGSPENVTDDGDAANVPEPVNVAA
jgi:antirestriction protein ArdC